MKKLNIASTITNIDDAYIQEALDMPMMDEYAIPQKRTFWQKLSDAVNHPVGVACICAVVALGVLVGIVAAGRNAPSTTTPPVGVGIGTDASDEIHTNNDLDRAPYDILDTQVHSENFAMIYYLEAGTSLKRGNTYNIQTAIQNIGKAFTYSGSSTEFYAEATLIYHSGQTAQVENLIGFEINAIFAVTEDYVIDFEIPTGKISTSTGHFIIPADAPTGQYDLKLSYKDEYVIYKNAVSIYSEDRFAFAYEGLDTIPSGIGQFNAGGSLTLTASVTNLGESFKVYEDHSDSFVPTVKFVCRETGYIIYATTSQSDDITTFIVGELEVGQTFYFADIPETADAGVYDLVLSYSNESRTFYEVLTVVNTIPEESRQPTPDFNPAPIQNEQEAIDTVLTFLSAYDAHYPFDLREDLKASAYYFNGDNYYTVILRKYLAGLDTDYKIQATISLDGVVTNVEETSWSRDSYFLQYTDADVQAAIDRIENQADGALYFEETDGILYVCKEVIVHNDSEIGHEHVFYREEVKHES